MNEFERALAKTDKREQRKTLHMPEPVVVAEITVPKEKRPSIDGVIRVMVTLPYDEFELTFTKANVVGMKKLTKADFHKAFSEGMRPLLGTLK